MGNAQSMDKVQNVVSEGIKIYQTVKKQQDQQQHQNYNNNHQGQQPHYNNNNGGGGGYQEAQQHYNHGPHHSNSGQHSPNYHPSADIDDDQEYSSLRQQAHEEAEKRNACYASSQEAYNNGDGARAKELSTQGHHHDNQMKHYNQKAADYIYRVKNAGRPSNEIDLHGLFIKEAAEKVEEAISRCKNDGSKDLVIIVGKGLHSPGQIAKLKPAIIDLVKKYNVSCQPNIPNPGCLYIEFGKGTGDLSWLDRITDKMSQNEQCLIM